MIKIAIIVGDPYDFYRYKATSRKLPKWMKDTLDKYEEFINDDNTIPNIVAVACYMSYHHPRSKIDCFYPDEISKKILNQYDVVYNVWEILDSFHCISGDYEGLGEGTCPRKAKNHKRFFKNLKAFVYPFPDFHAYINTKVSYYRDLKKAGLPMVPFFITRPGHILNSGIKNFKKRIKSKGWKGCIVKPSYGGYSVGLEIFKDISRTKTSTIKRKIQKLKDDGFPSLIVQKYVPSFGKHYEIKTIWFNNRYAYAVGIMPSAPGSGIDVGHTTFKDEGGRIPNHIKKKIKKTGTRVLKAIRQYGYKHPYIRIDFGCCIDTHNCKESYFVNEVETLPGYKLTKHSRYPAIQKMGKSLYKFAKKVKGKKNNPKPKPGKHSPKWNKAICKRKR